jgi:predicted dithiol-disulfide oxidoreductase (DUF899 family)
MRAELEAYKQRIGWAFPWASSFGSDFYYDFQVAYARSNGSRAPASTTSARLTSARARNSAKRPFIEWAATTGTDWATYTEESPGMSAFALDEGVVYHTYSAYARGLDGLWGMYQWLDRAPLGRNEKRAPDDPLNFFRRHDEYSRQ